MEEALDLSFDRLLMISGFLLLDPEDIRKLGMKGGGGSHLELCSRNRAPII